MNDLGHRHHDLGGRAAGPVVRDEHDYSHWEKRVDALMMLLWMRAGAITVDELRRTIEDLGPRSYDHMGYYEKWMHGIVQTLLARGLIHSDELGQRMAELEKQGR